MVLETLVTAGYNVAIKVLGVEVAGVSLNQLATVGIPLAFGVAFLWAAKALWDKYGPKKK